MFTVCIRIFIYRVGIKEVNVAAFQWLRINGMEVLGLNCGKFFQHFCAPFYSVILEYLTCLGFAL